MFRNLICLAVLALPGLALGQTPDKDGYTPLFNGKDLTGWVNVNCHPDSFTVKDGVIVTSGSPIGFMRTQKQYENFVLEMEWKHTNTKDVGNSGLFVWGDPYPAVGSPFTRGIEVQILVNLNVKDTYTSHGDVFSVGSAKCKPDRPHPKGWSRCLPNEERVKVGEWNHYKVTAKDGVIKLEVNGKEVSGVSECTPRKGYLMLESEGAECKFRNLKIKELPTSNPKPAEVADVERGHKSLFTGLDTKGWTMTKEGSWKVGGGNLKSQGGGDLEHDLKGGNISLFYDWKLPKGEATSSVKLRTGAEQVIEITFSKDAATIKEVGTRNGVIGTAKISTGGGWNRTTINIKDGKLSLKVNNAAESEAFPLTDKKVSKLIFPGSQGLDLMNIYLSE